MLADSAGLARAEDRRQFVHAALGLIAVPVGAGWIPPLLAALVIGVGWLVHHSGAVCNWTGSLVRPDEVGNRWFDGPSCYAYGLVLVLIFLPVPAATCGWLALAWGDSLSNMVGRRLPIGHFRANRSLGGAIGMAIGSGLGATTALILNGDYLLSLSVVAAVASGCVLAELFVGRWLDNVVIPLAGGLCFAFASSWFPLS